MFLGHVHHGQVDACIAVDADRHRRRNMRGAPELKLVVARAKAQLRAAGLVGAGVEWAEPDFDAGERFRRVGSVTFTLKVWSGFAAAATLKRDATASP